MKEHFTYQEVKALNAICKECPYWLIQHNEQIVNGVTLDFENAYCDKFKTDSLIFRYNKCEKLQDYEDKDCKEDTTQS